MIKRLKLSVSHVISNFSLKLSRVKPCVFSTRGHRYNRLPQSLRGIFVLQFAMFFPKVGATPCLQFAKKKNCIYFIETDHLKRREMHLALCIRRYSWKWFSWSIFSCNIFFRSNRIFQVPKKKRSRWLSPFKDINVVLYYLYLL